MVELIQELLLTHNCVIIPGLGAFLGNYNPAEIHLAENKIYPPGKTIAFNRTLKVNDGLLINALSQHSGVSYLMAEKLVNAFSKECQDSLLINKSVIIKNIGKL